MAEIPGDTDASTDASTDADADARELDVIAAELCAVPPAEFTEARNARAAANPRLARHIRALRKPVVSAWAVDRLASAGALVDALELAAELREAAEDLDAAELARLSRQRRALVSALAKQAVALAQQAGVAVSAAALADVERTIDAAVREPGAAAAVMSARLVKPLQASGIEPIDPATLADALAGSVPGQTDVMVAPKAPDDLAARRARKAAEKALRDAEREAAAAERVLTQAESRRDAARERVGRIEERLDGIRTELARIEAEAERARDDADARDDDAASAAEAARSARATVEAARAALD